jgi:hypothetical protein
MPRFVSLLIVSTCSPVDAMPPAGFFELDVAATWELMVTGSIASRGYKSLDEYTFCRRGTLVNETVLDETSSGVDCSCGQSWAAPILIDFMITLCADRVSQDANRRNFILFCSGPSTTSHLIATADSQLDSLVPTSPTSTDLISQLQRESSGVQEFD